MSSRVEEKRSAKEERLRRERAAAGADRRRKRMALLGGVSGVAALVVVIAIAISQSGSAEESAAPDELTAQATEIDALYEGIPQDGIALGSQEAPLTMVEFADPQCPFCAQYSEEALPTLVERYVELGRVRMELDLLTFIGSDSERAARLAYAASLQDRMWQFTELFFRNQGTENSGYATDEFLRRIAEATPGLDVERAFAERDSERVDSLLAQAVREAEEHEVDSTPSFLLGETGRELSPLRVEALSPEPFVDAIEQALASVEGA